MIDKIKLTGQRYGDENDKVFVENWNDTVIITAVEAGGDCASVLLELDQVELLKAQIDKNFAEDEIEQPRWNTQYYGCTAGNDNDMEVQFSTDFVDVMIDLDESSTDYVFLNRQNVQKLVDQLQLFLDGKTA